MGSFTLLALLSKNKIVLLKHPAIIMGKKIGISVKCWKYAKDLVTHTFYIPFMESSIRDIMKEHVCDLNCKLWAFKFTNPKSYVLLN